MRNTYLFLALLSLFIIGVLIAVFSIVGSPVSQQLIAYDKVRISDFSNIKYAIDTYYTTNKQLVKSLAELPSTTHITDPESKKQYTYNPKTNSQFQLCTNFSTDSTKQDTYSLNPYGTKPVTYRKGYACLDYELSSYVMQNNQYISPTPVSTVTSIVKGLQITSPATGSAVCLNTSQPITWETSGNLLMNLSFSIASQNPSDLGGNTAERLFARVTNPNAGTYSWMPGSSTTGKLPEGNKYYLVARGTGGNGEDFVISSGIFTLQDCSTNNKPQ